jgi:hypothetical protein
MNRTTGDSPYLFPDLTATRGGIPDPLVEVDCWLSQLQDVLDAGPETADEAYDLLALWAKLRRARPELIEQLEGMQVLAQADAMLAARGSDLASQALTVPNPRMWLLAVQALDQAFEDVGLAEARSTLAEGLLTDLDDATLALYAARRHGIDDRELESELEPCLDWLAENAGLFLPAAVHVQAMGMSLRPDLAEFDYGLAVTALKYVDICVRRKPPRKNYHCPMSRNSTPADARRLAARCQEATADHSRPRGFLVRDRRQVAGRMRRVPFARAGRIRCRSAPLLWWVWSSPAGHDCSPDNPAAAGGRRACDAGVPGRRSNGATDLAGRPRRCTVSEATIDPSGKATFLLSPLLETDQPLVLRVGPEQSEWPIRSRDSTEDRTWSKRRKPWKGKVPVPFLHRRSFRKRRLCR